MVPGTTSGPAALRQPFPTFKAMKRALNLTSLLLWLLLANACTSRPTGPTDARRGPTVSGYIDTSVNLHR